MSFEIVRARHGPPTQFGKYGHYVFSVEMAHFQHPLHVWPIKGGDSNLKERPELVRSIDPIPVRKRAYWWHFVPLLECARVAEDKLVVLALQRTHQQFIRRAKGQNHIDSGRLVPR